MNRRTIVGRFCRKKQLSSFSNTECVCNPRELHPNMTERTFKSINTSTYVYKFKKYVEGNEMDTFLCKEILFSDTRNLLSIIFSVQRIVNPYITYV